MNRKHASARRSDPATSLEAAKAAEEGGRAQTDREACLSAVCLAPGLTAGEIATRLGLERHIPSRRLPELRAQGKVENGPARLCRVLDTKAMTWNPAQPRAMNQGTLL